MARVMFEGDLYLNFTRFGSQSQTVYGADFVFPVRGGDDAVARFLAGDVT